MDVYEMFTLALGGFNFLFIRFLDHCEKERKRHELALEKLQMVRDKWDKEQMKRIEKRQAQKAYIEEELMPIAWDP